jgi:hypothetical protein
MPQYFMNFKASANYFIRFFLKKQIGNPNISFLQFVKLDKIRKIGV